MFTRNRKKMVPIRKDEEQVGSSRVSAKNMPEGSVQFDVFELEPFVQNPLGQYPV